MNIKNIVFGLTRPRIVLESTSSIADALSTRRLNGFLDDQSIIRFLALAAFSDRMYIVYTRKNAHVIFNVNAEREKRQNASD